MFVLGSYITPGRVKQERPMGSLNGKVALDLGMAAALGQACEVLLTRARTHRILEVAFRPVTEASRD
jgi:hypothetical protein